MKSGWHTVWDFEEELEKYFTWEGLEELDSMMMLRGKTIYLLRENGKKMRLTPEDVIYYYAHDARNIVSGCRRLGEIVGDWRPIDHLAQTCLAVYKCLQRPRLIRECKKYGMEPRGW